tara:strand:- start:5741 stop:6256 length:516 start_codon:yes stop_codon:yes gene_type:complete
MENKPKTHYRKVFKSDHLGVADLEEYQEQKHSLIFTISHVNQEVDVRVAGRKMDGNIAYFVEGIKPLVLNATNSKVMKVLTNSSFLEDWTGVAVQLYIDPNVSMKGDVVGGVRINPNPVRLQKRVITPEDAKLWDRAVKAYKRDGNLVKVLQSAEISQEHQSMIIQQANNV